MAKVGNKKPVSKRGGKRKGAGPNPKYESGNMAMYSFRISLENRAFLQSLPRGTVGDFLNGLIEAERKR